MSEHIASAGDLVAILLHKVKRLERAIADMRTVLPSDSCLDFNTWAVFHELDAKTKGTDQ